MSTVRALTSTWPDSARHGIDLLYFECLRIVDGDLNIAAATILKPFDPCEQLTVVYGDVAKMVGGLFHFRKGILVGLEQFSVFGVFVERGATAHEIMFAIRGDALTACHLKDLDQLISWLLLRDQVGRKHSVRDQNPKNQKAWGVGAHSLFR